MDRNILNSSHLTTQNRKPFSFHSFSHTSKSFSDAEMAQKDAHLAPIVGDHQPQPQPQSQAQPRPPRPITQQGVNNVSIAAQANAKRLTPNLPHRNLIAGPRETYLEFGVPLYEACIKCNWKVAEAILNKKPELVRFSITDHMETPLHVAASAKDDPEDEEDFVKKLVGLMTKEDLELENENFNTALYLAAAAGNIKAVKIMVEKNNILPTIPGANGQMLPLYAAALFGNGDVVTYLYEKSKDLADDCWTDTNRSWLLERCVENDMFDIALKIVEKYPKLGGGSVLRVLARKPESFSETISSSIGKTVKSVFAFIGSKVGAHEKECKALILLKTIWKDIAKKPRDEIDRILRGPPDSKKQDKSASGSVVQAIQLQNLISEQLGSLEVKSRNIIKGQQPDSTTQDSNQTSAKLDHALQLEKLISDYIVNLQIESHRIVKQDKTLVVGEGDRALELQKQISKHIVNIHDDMQNILKRVSEKEAQAQNLQKLITRSVNNMRAATKMVTPLKETYSSRVLFIAAEWGNTKFLIELIGQYPDLIWKVDDNNQSIFHIAVKHRNEGIYNLLYEIGAMKDLITPLKDKDENNMLHLVGTRAKQKQLHDVSGVALQMQRELLWFQEVEKMIQPSYRTRKNKNGFTPRELFTTEHKELVSQGEKWMKGTANQCMIVAALIATIVFAAAFTVPGGYDQNNGIPIFHSKATFVVFVVADAVSLFLSCASILIFLSILTSRYAESDFLDSLPKKLVSGLLTLFLSIATMVVSFAISFFVLYHKGMLWIPILICVFAVVPVILYFWLQFGLFIDVFLSTYRSRYLFKPTKHVLYYVNPRI